MDRRTFFGKSLAPLAAVAAIPLHIDGIKAEANELKPKTKYLVKCDPNFVSKVMIEHLRVHFSEHQIDALIVYCPSKGVEIFELEQ